VDTGQFADFIRTRRSLPASACRPDGAGAHPDCAARRSRCRPRCPSTTTPGWNRAAVFTPGTGTTLIQRNASDVVADLRTAMARYPDGAGLRDLVAVIGIQDLSPVPNPAVARECT